MAAAKQAELELLVTEEGERSEPSGTLPAGGARLRVAGPLGVFVVLAVIVCLAISPSDGPVVPRRLGVGFQAGLMSSRRRSHRSRSGFAGLLEEAEEVDEADDDPSIFQQALAFDEDKDGLLSLEELLKLLETKAKEADADPDVVKDYKDILEEHFPEADKDGDSGLNEEEFENLLSSLKGDPCNAHSDCSNSKRPFCYAGTCQFCRECQFCHDGVDGTCGPCGEGFPTKQNETCHR